MRLAGPGAECRTCPARLQSSNSSAQAFCAHTHARLQARQPRALWQRMLIAARSTAGQLNSNSGSQTNCAAIRAHGAPCGSPVLAGSAAQLQTNPNSQQDTCLAGRLSSTSCGHPDCVAVQPSGPRGNLTHAHVGSSLLGLQPNSCWIIWVKASSTGSPMIDMSSCLQEVQSTAWDS